MFVIGARWSEPELAPPVAPGGVDAFEWGGVSNAAFAGTLLASVMAVSLPPLLGDAIQRSQASAAAPVLALPKLMGEWQAVDGTPALHWRPRFVNPSVEAAQAYVREGQAVGVFVAFYRGQGPDRKLVSASNALTGSRDLDWNQVTSGRRELQLAGHSVTLRTAELFGPTMPGAVDRPRLRVWATYWVNGRMVHSEPAAKWHSALALLRGQGDDGAAIVLYTDIEERGAAIAALDAFANANLGRLDALLRQTASQR
jgi:EpsI family protein